MKHMVSTVSQNMARKVFLNYNMQNKVVLTSILCPNLENFVVEATA